MSELQTLEIETRSNPEFAIIWLHGIGADGHDFADLPEHYLPKTKTHAVRYIFPHAPEIPVTANGGYILRAWYDILAMTVERQINKAHLMESVHAVWDLIDREISRGIPSENIILAGFSQGGAVAYQAALNCNKPLGGLIAISTYIADAGSLEYAPSNQRLPILIHHGDNDPIVLVQQSRKALELLRNKEYDVSYQNYPSEHHLCPEQLSDIDDWLSARCHTPAIQE